MKTIKLKNGPTTQVDDDLPELIYKMSWKAKQMRNGSGKFYAYTHINRKTTHLHRLVIGAESGQIVDHIDGDTLNNQRTNLRICSPSQNQANRKKNRNNASGFRGVYQTKAKTWAAMIRSNGKRKCLGTFQERILAANAYDAAALEIHGQFARLNFPSPAVLNASLHSA